MTKVIARKEMNCYGDFIGIAYFVNTGKFSDGRLSYSKLDQNGYIIEKSDGCYVQVRNNGSLYMVHI